MRCDEVVVRRLDPSLHDFVADPVSNERHEL